MGRLQRTGLRCLLGGQVRPQIPPCSSCFLDYTKANKWRRLIYAQTD